MVVRPEKFAEDSVPSYGAMRSTMPDHIYVTDPNAQIYTSPCIVAGVATPFDVLIAITACRQPVTLKVGDSLVRGSAVAAPARERFLDARGVRLSILQFGPFHPIYPLFRQLHGPLQLDRDRLSAFDRHLEAAYEGRLSLADSQELSNAVLAEIVNFLPKVAPLDRRVQEVMRLLFDDPRVPLEQLAAHNGLSYDRMSHLFIDELGISIRSFQVWVKLHRALTGIREGQSLIELAQIAGFSDAAHLSRVYKQVYGAPPSYFYYSGNVKLVASFAGTEIPKSTRLATGTAA
jgi:AraC family transcriptional regulator of arabinose operon